jgi:hypothetical protein
MWPWEHLAVGYVLYSGIVNLRPGGRLQGSDVATLAVATQLPDLVDKPLAWTLGVIPNGFGLAHTLLVAVPVVTLVTGWGYRYGRPSVGVAFAVGYLSHLAGDVLYPVVKSGGPPNLPFLFQPFVSLPDRSVAGFVPRFRDLLAAFFEFVASPQGQVYLTLETLLIGGALLLWAADGCPGAREALGVARSVVDA